MRSLKVLDNSCYVVEAYTLIIINTYHRFPAPRCLLRCRTVDSHNSITISLQKVRAAIYSNVQLLLHRIGSTGRHDLNLPSTISATARTSEKFHDSQWEWETNDENLLHDCPQKSGIMAQVQGRSCLQIFQLYSKNDAKLLVNNKKKKILLS